MVRTIILKVSPINPEEEKLKIAAEEIKQGEVVIFPTETVYGIGADALNEDAVKKVFKAKNRPYGNPLIVGIANQQQLLNVVEDIPPEAERLISKFWPGPLTLILKKKPIIPDIVSAGLDTIAIRMPAHPVPLKLMELAKTPIVVPSANIAGRPSITTPDHVIKEFRGKVKVIITAGETSLGIESTVLNLYSEPPIIIRPGAIPKDEIEKILGRKILYHPAIGARKSEITAKAPSHKFEHYKPIVPLILVEGDETCLPEEIINQAKKLSEKHEKIGIMISKETIKRIIIPSILTDKIIIKVLGSRRNLYEVAHNLFRTIRELEDKKVGAIIAEGYDYIGIGYSVMYRLNQAAYQKIKCK